MKKEESKLKVFLIVANPHSGSTLLDIILGTLSEGFSAGELTFITRTTIFEEFCSCREKVKDCKVWREVHSKWLTISPVNYETYKALHWRYERNKKTLSAIWNMFFPSKDFKNYKNATSALFEAIQQVTNSAIIIDSSKAPQRIPVLKDIVDLKVIHLCRNFSGVMNSRSKSSKKDVRAGIEVDQQPSKLFRTLIEWIFINLLAEFFKLFVKSKKIKYNEVIDNINSLTKLDTSFKPRVGDGYFKPHHLIAGNRLRLNEKIIVNKEIGFAYPRLTSRQRVICGLIDKLFWFWA